MALFGENIREAFNDLFRKESQNDEMRKFNSILFLGNGKYSLKEVERLKDRLVDGINILGGLQQPPHSESKEIAELNKKHRLLYVKELDSIVKDIAMALTGKEIRIQE